MNEDVRQYLGQAWTDFQRRFTASLETDIPLLKQVNRYVLEHGGKKLRPTFTMLIARALGGRCDELVVSCAVAVELLHTATLLHDDVADEAQIRRDAPTLVALYSPTTAVLIGDFWLSRAVDMVIDHPDKRVIRSFAKCLGDLARGEMLQLECADRGDTSEADYRQIIYCKTSSLFEAAVLTSAYSVGASEIEIEACRQYAFHVGQAYQMMDDILDYSPELAIGKPTGQDIMERKITLPLLCLLKKAPAVIARRIRRQMKKPDEGLVKEIFSLIRQYDALSDARAILKAEIQQAVEALAPIPVSEAKSYLEKIAVQLAVRTA